MEPRAFCSTSQAAAIWALWRSRKRPNMCRPRLILKPTSSFGAGIDESPGRYMRITVIATGFDYAVHRNGPPAAKHSAERPPGRHAGAGAASYGETAAPADPAHSAHLSAGHGGSPLHPSYDDPASCSSRYRPSLRCSHSRSSSRKWSRNRMWSPRALSRAPLSAHERAQHCAQLQPRADGKDDDDDLKSPGPGCAATVGGNAKA